MAISLQQLLYHNKMYTANANTEALASGAGSGSVEFRTSGLIKTGSAFNLAGGSAILSSASMHTNAVQVVSDVGVTIDGGTTGTTAKIIWGGAGEDTIIAGASGSLIYGGGTVGDKIILGEGKDTVILDSMISGLVISGFSSENDIIRLYGQSFADLTFDSGATTSGILLKTAGAASGGAINGLSGDYASGEVTIKIEDDSKTTTLHFGTNMALTGATDQFYNGASSTVADNTLTYKGDKGTTIDLADQTTYRKIGVVDASASKGNNVIKGYAEAVSLIGGTGADTIYAGGSTVGGGISLAGGLGKDTFVLNEIMNSGIMITDYKANEDVVIFDKNTFADISNIGNKSNDKAVTLTAGTGSVTLNGAVDQVISLKDSENNTKKILMSKESVMGYAADINEYYVAASATTGVGNVLSIGAGITGTTLWMDNTEAIDGAAKLTGVTVIDASAATTSNTFYGNSQDNHIIGGTKADVLWGGKGGINSLRGGLGADTFFVDTLGGGTIEDYTTADQDVLSFYANEFSDVNLSGAGKDVIVHVQTGNTSLTGAADKAITIKDKNNIAAKVLVAGEKSLAYSNDINVYFGSSANEATQTLTIGQTNNKDLTIWMNAAESAGGPNLYGVNIFDGSQATGNNTIYGNGESNLIIGGAGNDIIWGGMGAGATVNTLNGGAGIDTYFLDSVAAVVNYSSKDGDMLSFYKNELTDVKVDLDTTKKENVVLTIDSTATTLMGAADAVMNMTDKYGNLSKVLISNAKTLTYAADINAYFGGTKKELTIGKDATAATIWLNAEEKAANGASVYDVNDINASSSTVNNAFYGNEKNNKITAGSGNDFLWGGKGGINELTGGAGSDTFYVTANAAVTATKIKDAGAMDSIMFLNTDIANASCVLNASTLTVNVDGNNTLEIANWSTAKGATFLASSDNGVTTKKYTFDETNSKFIQA